MLGCIAFRDQIQDPRADEDARLELLSRQILGALDIAEAGLRTNDRIKTQTIKLGDERTLALHWQAKGWSIAHSVLG